MSKSVSKPIPAPICTACFDFAPDQHQKEKRTIIIAPIIIKEIQEGSTKIGWACSRADYCHDSECRYSKRSNRKGTEDEGWEE